MVTINISFPKTIDPYVFEHTMEESVRQNSDFRIKVKFIDSTDEENTYTISSKEAEALFLTGVAAGKLLSEIRKQ